MSLFKKLTGALNTDKKKNNSTLGKSVSCGNISGRERPSTPPLSDFISDTNNSGALDLGIASSEDLQSSNSSNNRHKSRLSKTTKEVLHDPPALAYFIQYLEARDAVQLVKFWLDVESFRSSAAAVISSPLVSSSQEPINISMIESRIPEHIQATESFDSGLGKHDPDLDPDLDLSSAELNSSVLSQSEQKLSRAESILKTRTEDAVNIYRRYIAPDCSRPLHLPTEFKAEIVERICAETGQVSADCFTAAQEKVVEILELEYFPDFLKSEYHAKHQVDVLTGGQVYLADILYNDTALAHFMEFMETMGKRHIVEFWMTATNFHQLLNGDTSQDDAMVLYEKYFSMQASSPLGFNDAVRLQIENNICSEEGPDQTCFDMPRDLVVKYLEYNYLQKFLISPMFKNYIKELIGTITASPRTLSYITPGVTSTTSASSVLSDDQSDCSSEVSVQVREGREVASPKTNNTLLAMASATTSPDKSFSIEKETSDPDLLWRRNNVRDKIGKINSLGRYEPGWDLAPHMNRNDGTKKTSRISKAVKKLVSSEDHEKMKEEMAWQVAEMFVKEVTSVTMAENMNSENNARMSTSYSCDYSLSDLSLDLDNLEVPPPAKYF